MIVESAVWIWLSGLLFAIFHSLSAADQCKQWFYRHGISGRRYRFVYSVVAILTTVIWLYYIDQLPDSSLYQTDGLSRMVLMMFQGVGLLLLLAAFQPIDGLAFLGLRKADSGIDPFIVDGVYRWLRHPMYTGVMLILLAMPDQTYNGLHFSLFICLYFVIGSRFEERRMIREHADYDDYRRDVAAFIPKIRRK